MYSSNKSPCAALQIKPADWLIGIPVEKRTKKKKKNTHDQISQQLGAIDFVLCASGLSVRMRWQIAQTTE